MIQLVFLFALTALLYSMAGFGGGSTYNALLVLQGVDYRILPSIALVCNIIVVSNGVIQYGRSSSFQFSRIAPILLLSAPAAWAGGRTPVSETFFIGLLGFLLVAASLLMFWQPGSTGPETRRAQTSLAANSIIGAVIGFVSGLAGIGGGIFLAPVLYLTRWGRPREIAAAASIFILVNSLSGLGGQLMKLGDIGMINTAFDYWPLPLAVACSGAIGAFLGANKINPRWVKMLTAILVMYVGLRLLAQLFHGGA